VGERPKKKTLFFSLEKKVSLPQKEKDQSYVRAPREKKYSLSKGGVSFKRGDGFRARKKNVI